MTTKRFALGVMAVLIIGCATVQVSQDYDTKINFYNLHTFAWQHAVQPASGDARLDNSLTDERVRQAVERHLISAGFRKVDKSSADFLVAYHQTIRPQIASDNVGTRIGFGIGSRGHFGGISLGTGSEISSYDEGALFIDILAPDNGRLLWRGTGTDTVSEHADTSRRVEQINEMVGKILDQFPPAR